VSETPPSSTDQIDDEDNQRNHKQQVDQGTRNVQAESQKPKDQQDYKNRPEHVHLFLVRLRPGFLGVQGTRNAFNDNC
jgi:hypothetical protein